MKCSHISYWIIRSTILIAVFIHNQAYAQDEMAGDEMGGIEEEMDFGEDSFDVTDGSGGKDAGFDSENFNEDFDSEDISNKEDLIPDEEPVEEMQAEAPPEDLEELEPIEEPVQAEAPPEEELHLEQVAPEEPTSNDGLHAESTPPPDEPNLEYEARLHDIYVNFYNSKMPEEEWNTLVGERSAERYLIQRGDNLWGISKTIFGDGHYWPKVWSLNTEIKNPHQISPNNSIRFLLGDESEPPAFTITENATVDQEEVVQSAPAQEDVAAEPTPDIPPPMRVNRPVVKKLPPSLPEWQSVGDEGNFDDSGIDYVRRKITDIEDVVPLVSYVSEKEVAAIGRVREIEVGNRIASAFQYVYITMNKGVGEIGHTYLAIQNRGPVQSVHASISGQLGQSVDILGEIQLVERVSGVDENHNGEMFRGIVLKIINPVTVNSILVEGQLENVKVSEQGPRSQVVAQIIGGSFFNRRQIYGVESITYLNRGSEDGIEVGQVLPIRANRAIRNDDTLVQSNIRPIGWLRIVKTTPHLSTAIVVKAWSDILTGDLTGSGELLSNSQASSDEVEEFGDLNEELDDDALEGDSDAKAVPESEGQGDVDEL